MGGVQALTPELMREAIAAVEEHGTITKAAEVLGVPRTTMSWRYQRAIKAGFDAAILHPAPASHTIKGVSTLYNAAGQVTSQWVKTRADGPSLDEIIEATTGAFEVWKGEHVGPYLQFDERDQLHDKCTIYPIADWHVGLLAWRRETGEDWDLGIAKSTIRNAMQKLVERSPASEQCVILGVGDLLHSDGYENTTAKSKNLLDVDGRWPKVLEAAVGLVIDVIDMALQKHQNVLVRILPGNHDEESAIAVSLALRMFYHGSPRVTIDADPSRFWWWSWGTNLFGATHGDKAKMAQLPLLMATRNPLEWGSSKFRQIFTGHIHTQTGIELGGVTVESFRTPAAPDSWHHSMGYGAGRTVTSITFDKTEGEIGRARAPIIAPEVSH